MLTKWLTLGRLFKKYFWRYNLQPEYVIFQSTSRCNLHCKHCFLWQGNQEWQNTNQGKYDLTLKEITKISQSMKDFFFLNIGGGEPFTRSDLPQIAKIFYTNNHVQNLLIPTNGTLTKKILASTEAILKNCPNLNVHIDVSIDGIGPLHNKIREGNDTFNKAIKTIYELKKLNTNYPRLMVGTITAHMTYNQQHLGEIYSYIKTRLKPDSPTIALTRGTPRQPQAKDINIDYYRKLTQTMERDFIQGKVAGFKNVLFWPLIMSTKILMHQMVIATYTKGYQIPCLAGRLNVVIYSNGDVYPCEMLTDQKIGNLREVDYNFQKLWQSTKLKRIVKKIVKTKCFCTHECHLPMNILYAPQSLPKLLILSLKILAHHRQ